MLKTISALNVAIVVVAFFCSQGAHAAYSHVSTVISSGGGSSASGNYVMTGTIGQPVAGGPETAGSYTNQSGFWNIRTGDTLAPTVTGFTLDSPFRSRIVPFQVPMTVSASDLHGIRGYYFTTDSTPPVNAWGSGWNDSQASSLALNTKGPQSYYVWAKDEAGNISTNVVSASTDTILQYLLNVSLAGSGTSITGSPGAIACMAGNTGTCSAVLDENSSVSLSGAPDAKSEVSSWSGADTVNGNPINVTMTGDRNVTGTFTLASGPTRVVYDKSYPTLLESVQALATSGEIQALGSYASVPTENILFNKGFTSTLTGGMSNTWDPAGEFSTIKGTLKISNGRLNIKGIKIKP